MFCNAGTQERKCMQTFFNTSLMHYCVKKRKFYTLQYNNPKQRHSDSFSVAWACYCHFISCWKDHYCIVPSVKSIIQVIG